MIAVTRRRGRLLVDSNMLLRIGASAMIGSALSTAAIGMETSLSRLHRLASIAASTPRMAPATSPTSALSPLASAASRMFERCSTSSLQIADGAGSTYGAMRPTLTSSSQPRMPPTPTMSGGRISLAHFTTSPRAAPAGPR